MRRLLMGVFVFAAGVVLLSPKQAEARRPRLVIFTHGESIKHVADLPAKKAAMIKRATGKDLKVGYKYSGFGVLEFDLWTWGGEFCLYEGDTYYDATPEQIAALMGTTKDKLPVPFFYRFPPGLIIILVGMAIWIP